MNCYKWGSKKSDNSIIHSHADGSTQDPMVHPTLVGWGLFLLVGEVGLADIGVMCRAPSKSRAYCVLYLSLSALEGLGKTFLEDSCLSRFSLADFTLCFCPRSFFAAPRCFDWPSRGVFRRAVADLVRPSLLRGRLVGSDIMDLEPRQLIKQDLESLFGQRRTSSARRMRDAAMIISRRLWMWRCGMNPLRQANSRDVALTRSTRVNK